MPDLWSDLLDCLDLTPADSDAGWTAPNQTLDYHRVFGGQILGQFIVAAQLTCPDKSVKSVHTQVAKQGRADTEMRFDVQRHHEGRTFATLTITARQDTDVVATAAVSMHTREGGPDHQSVAPVPGPPGPEHAVTIGLIPWEIRTAIDIDDEGVGPPDFEMWMRTPAVVADLAPALAAYATDLTLIGTALRPVDGASQRGSRTAFASAVTSHTVWFHRPFVTDSWLLLRQHSPVLAHARAFGRGDILTEQGSLVASYAQESLIRFAG